MYSPKLSIIIPFYKGEQFIIRLLDSIKHSLEDTKEIEKLLAELILIIDSPESDANDVSGVLNRYTSCFQNITILKNKQNLGVASTRNKGIKESKGEYLYFLDQDDEVTSDFFYNICNALKSNPEFVLLNGFVEYTNKNLNRHLLYYLRPKIDIKNLILDDLVRSPGQVIIKKSVIKELEFPVVKDYFGSDDKFFWILIFLYNPFIKTLYINLPLYKAQIHEANYSNKKMELQRCSIEIWKMLINTHDVSTIRVYMKRNISYLKFILRSQYNLSIKEKIGGCYEVARYFLRLNKFVRYFKKHY